MGQLVRDHIVRQAGEDQAVRRQFGGMGGIDLVPAEFERAAATHVAGIGALHGVRHQLQPLAVEAPARLTAKRAAEHGIGAHRHRIDHLVVEHRIGRCRIVTVDDQQAGLVEIDGRIVAERPLGHRDDLETGSDRPGLERLERDVDLRRLPFEAAARGIDRVDLERPVHRIAGRPLVT